MHRNDLFETVRELALILAAAAPLPVWWLMEGRALPAGQPLWAALDGWQLLLLSACLLPPVWVLRHLMQKRDGKGDTVCGEPPG